jgi:hypothetical protein
MTTRSNWKDADTFGPPGCDIEADSAERMATTTFAVVNAMRTDFVNPARNWAATHTITGATAPLLFVLPSLTKSNRSVARKHYVCSLLFTHEFC